MRVFVIEDGGGDGDDEDARTCLEIALRLRDGSAGLSSSLKCEKKIR